MSYSPTVYSASYGDAERAVADARAALFSPRGEIRSRHPLEQTHHARVLVEVLHEPRGRVRVQVVDERPVADVYLILFE